MINATLLGQRLAEEIINEAGPCFYPGKFKPPHIGHYAAAKNLASRDYIKMVYVIISQKEIDGINADDSLLVWNMFLQAEPNPKIKAEIATEGSPIENIIDYLKKNPSVNPVYIAGGDDERDDENYLESLQKQFGKRVKAIQIHEKSGIISAPYVRDVLKTGDFESYAGTIPEAAYNKGVAPKAFKLLAFKVKNGEI